MSAVLLKVFTLAVRTASKPLANRFQEATLSHPTFKRYAVKVAQALHRLDVRITRGAEGKSGKAFVGDLTEENALELASKVCSEGFVFAVGVAVVVFEYQRQSRKDGDKKVKEEQLWRAIEGKIEEEKQVLENQAQQHNIQLRDLKRRLDRIEQQMQEQASKRSNGWFGAPKEKTA